MIFIHVPKTAGSSIKEELYNGGRVGGHRSLAEYAAFDRRRTEDFLKVCFVRNPMDRFLSAYTYLKQGKGRTWRDREFAKQYLAQTRDVNDFARKLAQNKSYRARVMRYDHFRPQSHWICLPGATGHSMDFIGRFENLNEDMAELRRLLGLPDAPLPQIRMSRQDTFHRAYDMDTTRAVAWLYARDVALLGYDNISSASF